MFQGTDPAHETRSKAARFAWQDWCRDYCVVLLTGAFLVYSGIAFSLKGERSLWHTCFVPAAKHMFARQPIHESTNLPPYSYPPAMAWLSIPLAHRSLASSLLGWWLVNVAAMVVFFRCAWQLAGGPRLVPLARHWRMVLAGGLVLAGRWVITPLELQQFDVVIAALLLAGCFLLWRGQSLAAGALLGAATAMKCTPLLFAPYLLWRGKPWAALMLIAVAIGLNVLPDLLLPKADGGSYLVDWVAFVREQLAGKAPGSWASDLILNQSLGGFFNRLVRCNAYLSPAGLQTALLSPAATMFVKLATYGSGLILLAVSWWRLGRPWQPPQVVSAQDPVPLELTRVRFGWEVSLIFCLMLLLSPMTGKAHYVVLLLPCLLLSRQLLERPSTLLCIIFALLLVCGPLTLKGLIGKTAGDLMLVLGMPTWFVLAVWLGAWCALRKPALASPLPLHEALPAMRAA